MVPILPDGMLRILLMFQHWKLTLLLWVAVFLRPGSPVSVLSQQAFPNGLVRNVLSSVLAVFLGPLIVTGSSHSHMLEVRFSPFPPHEMVSSLNIWSYFSEFDVHQYACFCFLLSIAAPNVVLSHTCLTLRGPSVIRALFGVRAGCPTQSTGKTSHSDTLNGVGK